MRNAFLWVPALFLFLIMFAIVRGAFSISEQLEQMDQICASQDCTSVQTSK